VKQRAYSEKAVRNSFFATCFETVGMTHTYTYVVEDTSRMQPYKLGILNLRNVLHHMPVFEILT
jgi:hypothetical protein